MNMNEQSKNVFTEGKSELTLTKILEKLQMMDDCHVKDNATLDEVVHVLNPVLTESEMGKAHAIASPNSVLESINSVINSILDSRQHSREMVNRISDII